MKTSTKIFIQIQPFFNKSPCLPTDWGTEDADDEDVSVWEDNWEDDIVQDDFNQQLRLVFLVDKALLTENTIS